MEPIAQLKEKLQLAQGKELEQVLETLRADERKGAQVLLANWEKKREKEKAEQARLLTLLQYEKELYQEGYRLIAGIDEVGRGPLAGPVMAAAVILPEGKLIAGINDSKKLTAKKREELSAQILEEAVAYGFGEADAKRIDEINILQATYEAMRQALASLVPQPDFVLADAVTIPEISFPQKGVIGGDAKSLSIGAASIIAKVKRDHYMEEMDALYPVYGFASNKGYGSAQHIAAIREFGLCPLHRRTFVKNFVQEEMEQKHYHVGVVAERQAAMEMKKMGYTILEANYKSRYGEIDLIAEKDGYLVFTEVKYRQSEENGAPAEAIDFRKRKCLIQTAQVYLAEKGWTDRDCRFDTAELIRRNGKLYFRYTPDAFGAE